MNAFIDANVIVYAVSDRDPAANCERLLVKIAEGAVRATTSIAVLEEVWHLELSGKVPGLSGQAERMLSVFGEIVPVSPASLRLAMSLDAPPRLGANDRLHIGVCLEHGIDTIVSADRGFDDIAGLTRIDPFDAAALHRLEQ